MTPSTRPFTVRGTFRDRCERVKRFDEERNSLLEELLGELEITRGQLEQLQLEHTRELQYSQNQHRQEAELTGELQIIRTLISRNSYVTVLIDGDSLMFLPRYLSQGEQGGALAAEALINGIANFLSASVPSIQNYQIHVKCYAQLADLARVSIKTNIISNNVVLEDFWRGFGHKDILFDLVNTRISKATTVEKVRENYLSDFMNVHCQQILLAVLPSEDYNGLFEEIPDIQADKRVTLLEAGQVKSSEMFAHRIHSVDASDLFVRVPSENSAPVSVTKSFAPPTKVAAPRLARVESDGGSMTYKTAATNPASTPSTPQMTWASMTAQSFVPGPSVSTAQTAMSTVVATPAPIATKACTAAIQRNKYGQRIDAVDKSIEYKDLSRIKQLKLCNIHYLQGPGYCEGKCGHDHSYQLKPSEKKILREVARMTPCYFKLDCTDPGCIYGHRCPQSRPDRQDCYYKHDCRFVGWGHGIDEKVVSTKTVKG